MSLEKFLSKNPNKREVMEILCESANLNVLPINEFWAWSELSEKFGLSMNDFYDDQEALTEYERSHIGLYNWKIKD